MRTPGSVMLRRTISLLLSVLLSTSSLVMAVPPAHADAPAAAVSSALDLPAGSVEVPERSTRYATHYRLPDGSYRAELSAGPVHYKTPDGSWRDIDPDLVPSLNPGVSRNAANEVKAEFASGASGRRPVHITDGDWTFDIEPLFGVVGDHFDHENVARFSNVARDTDIEYESGASGIKETVLLRSAAAPTTFAFKLSFTGLDLRSTGREWALYPQGGFGSPELRLGDLLVEDSASESAMATGATMDVRPIDDGAIVTYTLPDSWLSDPARVFPVKVDPSVWWNDEGDDTYVQSQYPDSGASREIRLQEGRQASPYNVYEAFLRFDMGRAGVPALGYPNGATLSLYSDANSVAQTGMGVGTPGGPWDANITWNTKQPTQPYSLLATVSIPAHPSSGVTVTVSGNGALTDKVKNWYWDWKWHGTSNDGFVLWRQNSDYVTQNFHSADNPTHKPLLGISYVLPSASIAADKATVRSDDSDVVSATVTVDTGGSVGAVSEIQKVTLKSDGNDLAPTFTWDSTSGFAPSSPEADVTLLTNQCTVSSVGYKKYVTFKFKVKPSFGGTVTQNLHTTVSIGRDQEQWWVNSFDGPTLSVIPGSVTPTLTTRGLDWWRAKDTTGPAGVPDGVPDILNDFESVGRGAVDLSWPSAGPVASGYRVEMFDGNDANAAWQEVGQVIGSDTTTWTTEGLGIFPTDSEVASYPVGYGGNPYTRISSPRKASQVATFSAANAAGAGLVLSDGKYLYVRPYGGNTSSTWRKYGTGFRGSEKYRDYGNVGSSVPAGASAFMLDGFIYNGSAITSRSIQGVWSGASSGATETATLTFSEPLLMRQTAAPLSAPSTDVLLAASPDRVYSLGRQVGGPGFVIREFNRKGNFVAEHAVDTGGSYDARGLLCDGKNLYITEYGNAAGDRVDKVSLGSWRVLDEWTMWTAEVAEGCYDFANNLFWLGSIGGKTVYQYLGPGLDLRDDPRALYAKMGTASHSGEMDYRFRVVPYNSAGDAATKPEMATTLPNRSIGVNDDLRETTHELEDIAGADAQLSLQPGTIQLQDTDIQIESWGPEAAVSRSYDSARTDSTRFAPGWRFNFEQHIETGNGFATYVDAEGVARRFIVPADAGIPPYVCPGPNGFYSKLYRDSTGWHLVDKDRSVTYFLEDGRLDREVDKNSQTVKYDWVDPGLVITAANGQQIAVTLDVSGHATRASYETPDGSRVVGYSWTQGAADATVTASPGTEDEAVIRYTYELQRLSHVAALDFDGPGHDASWSIEYLLGKVRAVTPPSPSGQNVVTVVYPTGSSATASWDVYRGPTKSHAVTSKTYTWNPTGTMASTTNAHLDTEPLGTWTYSYGPSNEMVQEQTPSGAQTNQTVDSDGNVLSSWDEDSHYTTYRYDEYDQLVQETDPRGGTKRFEYDPLGNLKVEEQTLNAQGDRSRTEYSYNDSGTVTSTRKKVAEPDTWALTQLDEFSLSGEPGLTTEVGVALSSTETADVTTQRTFDDLGNLLTEENALHQVTETNTYNPNTGSQLSSTDASGAVQRWGYDRFGNAIDESTTAGSDRSLYANWRKTAVLVSGQPGLETFFGDDGVIDHTVKHDYFGALPQTEENSVLGADQFFGYDGQGHTVETWKAGANLSDPLQSQRSRYDSEGRVISETDPANADEQSTITTYFPNGDIRRKTEADGSWTEYRYDEVGNEVAQITPQDEDGKTATATTSWDLASRQTRTVGTDNAVTDFTYDLLGRQLSSSAGASATVTTYNTLGWVLSARDPDGVVHEKTYDAAGRVKTDSTIASGRASTTTFDYDATGRVLRQANPETSTVSYVYDLFGRVTVETQTRDGQQTRVTMRAYDALGRETSRTVAPSGYTVVTSYATDGRPDSSTTIGHFGETTLTITADRFGHELNRVSDSGAIRTTRSVTATDGAGRETGWSWITGLGTLTGLIRYDAEGRLATISGSAWSNPSLFKYDSETGRCYQECLNPAYPDASKITGYTYDAAGRLSTATALFAGEVTETGYTYDSSGQITKAGGLTLRYASAHIASTTAGPPNGQQVTTYGFDARGRRTQVVSTNASTTYVYDDLDHLATVLRDDGKNGVNATMTYTYDALGQRTQSVVTSGGVTTTTNYLYDGLTLLRLERKAGAENTSSISYLYTATGVPYAGVYTAPGGTTRAFGIVTGNRGDVVELVDLTGGAFASYTYSAYGSIVQTATKLSTDVTAQEAKDIAAIQPLRFAGYCYDIDTGLYYLSARYYDPATMQFLTKDPAKADGEESAYAYASGNPVSGTDPSGLYTFDDGPGGRQRSYVYHSSWRYQTRTFWGRTSEWSPGVGEVEFLAGAANLAAWLTGTKVVIPPTSGKLSGNSYTGVWTETQNFAWGYYYRNWRATRTTVVSGGSRHSWVRRHKLNRRKRTHGIYGRRRTVVGHFEWDYAYRITKKWVKVTSVSGWYLGRGQEIPSVRRLPPMGPAWTWSKKHA